MCFYNACIQERFLMCGRFEVKEYVFSSVVLPYMFVNSRKKNPVGFSSPSSSTSLMMSSSAVFCTRSPIICRMSDTVSTFTTPSLQKPLKHFISTENKQTIDGNQNADDGCLRFDFA